jgi:hypothetical protein
MKKKLLISIIIILFILILLLIFLNVEFKKGNKLIMFSYNNDISEFEQNSCYDDSYFYNSKRNISVYGVDIKKYFVFYVITLDYKNGNICDKEFLLKEEYIHNFIDNATIKDNDNKINLRELIKNKRPIIGNKRYSGNNYENIVEYILDGKHEIMYVFYVDNLLVIQVGNTDEGPKFIAYK